MLSLRNSTIPILRKLGLEREAESWEEAMPELHRILKKKEILKIMVPKGFCPAGGHKRFFEPNTFDTFIINEKDMDSGYQFKPLIKLSSWKSSHPTPSDITSRTTSKRTFPMSLSLELTTRFIGF